MVVTWGSRDRKFKSVFYFLVYTIVTSIGFLCVILILGYEVGSTNIIDLLYSHKEIAANFSSLLSCKLKKLAFSSEIEIAPVEAIVKHHLINFVLPLHKQIIC